MPIPTENDGQLHRFTIDGIVSETQKRALKKRGWIEYTHGSWSLTKEGQARAVRLGFLRPNDDEVTPAATSPHSQ